MTAPPHAVRLVAATAGRARPGALALSGCSVYDVPLPGGADTGDNPMKVKVMFRDVLDLVPQSTVKVNDVTVGKVKTIKLKGYVAEVDHRDAQGRRPAGQRHAPQIRQTSLLGEKFVSLAPPPEPGSGKLVEQRRHRPRPHRPQPRGRGGPRRPRPAAQRRWRRPAQDDRRGAQHRLRRPRPTRSVRCSTRSATSWASSTTTRSRSSPRWRTPTGWPAELREAGRHHQERAGRHPRRAALGQPPARRPGQAARGAQPPQRRRGPRDPGLQGVHHQQPARPGARARGLRQGGAELPQVLPGLPHLPVRRRGRRTRPAGGPQPAHGRLHQPLGQPRPRRRPAQAARRCRRIPVADGDLRRRSRQAVPARSTAPSTRCRRPRHPARRRTARPCATRSCDTDCS